MTPDNAIGCIGGGYLYVVIFCDGVDKDKADQIPIDVIRAFNPVGEAVRIISTQYFDHGRRMNNPIVRLLKSGDSQGGIGRIKVYF